MPGIVQCILSAFQHELQLQNVAVKFSVQPCSKHTVDVFSPATVWTLLQILVFGVRQRQNLATFCLLELQGGQKIQHYKH